MEGGSGDTTITKPTSTNANSNATNSNPPSSSSTTATTVSTADSSSYQIWQGRQGNFTRFVNHSCHPNSQYERFLWLGQQRVVLVSKGIDAGSEITVDYSDRYWMNLDKKCLCGETCCRFKDREEGGHR